MGVTGKFTWYELLTTDTSAAADFYAKVIGWKPVSQASADNPMHYTVFETAEGGVAGLMEIPPEAKAGGMPPSWVGYVSVDDVDAYAEKFVAHGGTIRRPPDDIPGVGRFAAVGDPQGAHLCLFKPSPAGPVPPSLEAPGYPSWRELMAADGPAAVAFYAGMFGWEKSTGHDMGPMGVYQLLAYDGQDRMGMMTKPPQVPAPNWGFYFMVDAAGAAGERVKAAGGTVLQGPMQVPTGIWVLQAQDPQGAHFGVNSPNP
jgi:predicted enzyme related to lactoylglutathione lyase